MLAEKLLFKCSSLGELIDKSLKTNNKEMEHLAQNLRSMRAVKGVTLEQAGEATGILYKTINKYETGLLKPTVENLLKLSNYLGVSTDTLLNEKISLSYKIDPRVR